MCAIPSSIRQRTLIVPPILGVLHRVVDQIAEDGVQPLLVGHHVDFVGGGGLRHQSLRFGFRDGQMLVDAGSRTTGETSTARTSNTFSPDSIRASRNKS